MKFKNYNYDFKKYYEDYETLNASDDVDSLYINYFNGYILDEYITNIEHIEKQLNFHLEKVDQYKKDNNLNNLENYEREVKISQAYQTILSIIKMEINDKKEYFILDTFYENDQNFKKSFDFKNFSLKKINKKLNGEIKIIHLGKYFTNEYYKENTNFIDNSKTIANLRDYTYNIFSNIEKLQIDSLYNRLELKDVFTYMTSISNMEKSYLTLLNEQSSNEDFFKSFQKIYELSEDEMELINKQTQQLLEKHITEICSSHGLDQTYTIKTDGYTNPYVYEGQGSDFSYWTEPHGIELKITTDDNFLYDQNKVYSLKEINKQIAEGKIYVNERIPCDISDEDYHEYFNRYNTKDSNILNVDVAENIFAKKDYLKQYEQNAKIYLLKNKINFNEIQKDYNGFKELKKEILLKLKTLLVKQSNKKNADKQEIDTNIKEVEEQLNK